MNIAPLQQFVVDLSEADEQCLFGGKKLETLKRLQEEFGAELSHSPSQIIAFIIF